VLLVRVDQVFGLAPTTAKDLVEPMGSAAEIGDIPHFRHPCHALPRSFALKIARYSYQTPRREPWITGSANLISSAYIIVVPSNHH